MFLPLASSGQEPLPSTLSIGMGMRGGVDCIGTPFTPPSIEANSG